MGTRIIAYNAVTKKGITFRQSQLKHNVKKLKFSGLKAVMPRNQKTTDSSHTTKEYGAKANNLMNAKNK